MTILSPETVRLHQQLTVLQEEAKQGPPEVKMEEFLATKKGRLSKMVSKGEPAVFMSHVLSIAATGSWFGVSGMTVLAYSQVGIPITDAAWLLGAFGGPIAAQVAISAAALKAGSLGNAYEEVANSASKWEGAIQGRIIKARSAVMQSAAEDLRRQNFAIIDSDEDNHSFRTHQGVVSLVTDPGGRPMAMLNGSPIQSSYADQAMFGGMEVTDASGRSVATRAPLIVDRTAAQ